MPVETSFAPRSESIELHGRSPPPTTSLHEAYRGSSVCLQCGRFTLPSSEYLRVCWNAGCAQGSNCSRRQDVSMLSEARRLRAHQAPLCDTLLVDFTDASSGQSIELDTPLADKAAAPNLPASIGVVVFFRLLKSLQQRRNIAGILKLIRQVPSLINNTPALSLSPHFPAGDYPGEPRKVTTPSAFAGLASGACPGRVVDAIISAAEGLLCGEDDLSSQQQGYILEAMVGLAVKRGSLAHCLRVVKLLFCSGAADKGSSIPGVGIHLKELERTQPSILGDATFREPGESYCSDSEGYEAGNLLLLDEGVESRTEEGRLEPGSPTSSVPPALRGVDVMKVDSTDGHHIALTAEGELLTWNCRRAPARHDNEAIAGAIRPPAPLINPSRGVHDWRPMGSDYYACCCTSRAVFDFDCHTGSAEADHIDRPIVQQVLAYKPSVADVACGQKHTLALLETGQVFSWGNGQNGRLGLGDTRDRPAACHVESIQGIRMEAVFCGVSHSLAVCSAGVCYAWGKNNSGQCGETDQQGSDALSPQTIEGLKNFPVTAMAGGWEHTLALTRCGALFSFGGGHKHGCSSAEASAVLGISAAETDGVLGKRGGVSPTRVCDDALGSARVKAIACGWDHCMAVTDNGELFTWGSGRNGQLGHGGVEARHVPTRVAFFATPANVRVRSVVGGRTYSAVVTVDGRVFKWGLNRPARASHGSTHGREGEGGEARSNDSIEEEAAVGASVPRQVAGVGVENPRALRLGNGAEFGKVLVELRSAEESHPSSTQLATSPRPVGSDDDSEPVGRVETTVALLGHFERLATPHIPRDAIVDVDRSVRQAVRFGKQLQTQLLHDGTLGSMSPTPDKEQPKMTRADHQELEVRAPDTRCIDTANQAPMCSGGRPWVGQGASSIVSRTPSPIAPFCVDISPRTFRSFLDLIKGIRQKMSSVPAAPARIPDTVDSSTAVPTGKRPAYKGQAATEAIGPESCEEPGTGSQARAETFGKPSKQLHGALAPNTDGFAVAPRSVRLEVLRGTLKLLKVNLFHLVRVAAMRRACREKCFVKPSSEIGGNPASNEGHECSRRETKGADQEVFTGGSVGRSDRLLSSRARGGTNDAERDNQNTPSAKKGEKFESLGQKGYYSGIGDCDEDMYGVIQGLHAELRTILEETSSDTDPETSNAALAVQAEAAETFRVGFSVFFPSNRARVRLLRDIVATITTAGSPSPKHAEHASDKEKWRRSHKTSWTKSQQWTLPALRSNSMMRLAVEALARDDYAATLVLGTFSHEGPGGDSQDDDETTSGESDKAFDAVELDAVMASLLSHCVGDLHKRLWEGKICDHACANGSCSGPAEAPCPCSRLLLVLQEHVVTYWGNMEGDAAKKESARDLSLAHAVRLLEQSLKIFTRLQAEGDQPSGGARDNRYTGNEHVIIDNLRNSFVSLIPVLCGSVVAVPAEGGGFITLAAKLLPLIVPLLRVVDRFDSPRTPKGACSSPNWLAELEEALAMLSSDLACGLIDMKELKIRHGEISPQETGSGSARNRRGNPSEGIVEVLLTSSPFLGYDHESFDWSGLEDEDASQPDSSEFAHALEVIAFQENATQELCGCSQPPQAPTPALRPTASNPTLGHPHLQHGLAHRQRRASHDVATKLSPIDAAVSPHGVSGQQSPSRAPTKNQGSTKAGGKGEAQANVAKGGEATGRQLDSIVDEARAEGFIQDLLCGRGTAQALYLWMTVPPESHLPVLHATSLATQGQGWGSYQSLGSQSVSDQQENESSHRRRRSRAFPSDVDAATRALVAVMIKSNGAVAEAATFARCRLDRASSPPRALKLVAAAVAEVREALAGLAESLEEDKCIGESKKSSEDRVISQNEEGGRGGRGKDSDRNVSEEVATRPQSATASTLTNIMRNCRFLLKCTARLPSIELARKSCQPDASSYRQQSSASRLPVDDRQSHRELSHILKRWATSARNNPAACSRDEGSAKELPFILQLMAEGRVEQALSATMTGHKMDLPASLDSLVAFAANPIPLGAIKTRMRLNDLLAKVRVSGFRLIHVIINETRVSPARRQIGARLVRSLSTIGGGFDNPGLFGNVGTGTNPGTVEVMSAYFDLFRHVLHEAKQEHSRLPSQDNANTAGSSSLLVFLRLLQSLATALTPSFLLHVFPASLTSGNSEFSLSRPAPATLEPANRDNQRWPGRTERASSCPSVVYGAEAIGSRPSLPADEESISAAIAALPVVGAILSGQGDVLTRQAWGLDSTRDNINIHNAVWRVLGVVSMQLCASAASWATHKSGGGGSFEPSQQQPAGELDRHSAASRQWWNAIQATLEVVCQELTRARDCLGNLQHSRLAEENVLSGTGAVRLLADPVSLPLPSTWAFPGLQEEDEKEGCAVSFWVWGPTRTATQQLDAAHKKLRGSGCTRVRGDTLEYGLRRKVFTQLREVCAQDKANVRDRERYLGIYLRPSLPREAAEKPGSTTDEEEEEEGFYVEMVVGRKIAPKFTGRRGVEGDSVDGSSDYFVAGPTSGDKIPDRQSEGHEGAGEDKYSDGQQFKMESVFSECGIPPGQWTHVCCAYSSTERGGGNDENDASIGTRNAGGSMPFYTVATITFNGSIVAKGAFSSCGVGYTADATTRSLDRAPNHSGKEYGNRRPCRTWTPNSAHTSSPKRREGTPAVCDLHWHPCKVSPEQARRIADTGIPTQREDVQRDAESYVARLVALAEKFATSSQRVVATLSSPRWLSLWLQLTSVAGHHGKRAILRLLHPLLCGPSQTIGEDVESTRATSKAAPGTPSAPPSTGNDVSDRAVVDRLCSLLGGSLRPLRLRNRGYRIGEGGGDGRQRRESNSLRQGPSTLSDIVLLLRSLVEEAPNRWREHVFGALAEGLAVAAKGELFPLSKSPASQRGTDADEDDQAWACLGAAAAAAYLGGGHIEGPRLGGRVVLLPRPEYASAGGPNNAIERYDGENVSGKGEEPLHQMLNHFCMPTDTMVLGEEVVKTACYGTVVGWKRTENEGMLFVAVDDEYRDCLDIPVDSNSALQGRCHQSADNNCCRSTIGSTSRVVSVQDRQVIFQAEMAEPTTPFFFHLALPSVLALLNSPPTSTTTVASCLVNDEATSGAAINQIGAHQLVAAHLRCRLLRALAVQLRDIGQADAAVRSKVLRPLLGLAASPLASAVVLALGSDGAVVFGRRRDFAAVILSLRYEKTASENSLIDELESACQVVWNRLGTGEGGLEGRGLWCRPRSADVKDGGVSDCRPICSPPKLQVLSGEALVEGSRVTASSHFPTIRLSHVRVGLGPSGQRWYYEVTLLTGGLMQLGWAGPGFRCNPTRGQGVGDHMRSWAFDGFRQKRWCVSSAPYGKRWRRGDVIGISLDAELQEMRFSMNGRDLGVAFVGFDMEGLFPACSMNVGQAALFNFGHSPFLYTPPTDSGGLCFRPVLEAVAHCASIESEGPCFTGDVGEDQAETACDDDHAHGDTHELTPRGTRASNVAVGAGRTYDEGYMQGRESEDISHLEIERQGLVENLIGMGFPVEWAVRAAGRSGSVMSESAATAWIIERLEIENTKMEEEMGNMDTCEEESAGGHSGIGDEYNDDTGESDDGDAHTAATGFRYSSEAAGIERREEEGAAGAGGGAGDRRWHDMYNAVRRTFIARSNGESPATAGAFTPGVTTEAGCTADGLVNPPPMAAALVAQGDAATAEGLRDDSHGLTRIAMSATEVDLPCLSLVLDTALSILFARAAMINLLLHVAKPSVKYSCPPVRLEATATTRGSDVGHGDETMVARVVAQRILETLADPENQQCVLDLTKALVMRPAPSRWVNTPVTFPMPFLAIEGSSKAGKGNIAAIDRNESMEEFRPGVCFNCAKVVAPIGLYPGSCILGMRSLFDLVHAFLKPRSDWKASCSEKPALATWAKADPPLSNPSDSEVSRHANVPSLTRLLTRFVREAISVFETDPTLFNTGSTGAKISATEHKNWGNERGTHGGIREPRAFRSKCLWALWVLETLLSLEIGQREKDEALRRSPDGDDTSSKPVWTASEENDDTCEELAEAASARSPQAFAATLRAAISNDLDETVQALACSLCSVMLNMSSIVRPTFSSSSLGCHETRAAAENNAHRRSGVIRSVPPEDGYELPSQEHSLARAFSSSLRSQVTTPSLSSHLLQSQLELLAQWKLRRSAGKTERSLHAQSTHRPGEAVWDQKESKFSCENSSTPGVEINDSWDVATALFAGFEGGSDGFETTQVRSSRTAAIGRRAGTADGETSVLSSLPTPRLLGKTSNHNSLLVEAVSATSVTVSWGGWFETDDELELQVGFGSGDCLARPLAIGKVPGTSDLAQELRSKLKHAASRQQDEEGPSLVLKVRACGLWGSEPFRVAALDLSSRGCLKVSGLAADTCYSFRLERRAASPSPGIPPLAADLSDDEGSFPLSAATVGANSTGESSADQLGADIADGASALTGLDGSGGGGGGGGSTCSEGCTTVLTDESQRQEGQASYCTSSTRAVAGRNSRPSGTDRYTNKRMEFQWPSMGGRDRFCATSEDFVTGRANGAIVATMSVATPPAVPFMLDAEGCGPNLRLTNSNLTVTNTGRKKWSAVRATRGFACGVHRWKVRIDRCVSKNVFVGVMSSESRLNNYVGSDRTGWGYLANKAIWHNKGKVRSYGDLFREGDTIGVTLNMDLGTIRFARNGRDLGLAVQGLEGMLYPAISMYNRNDQLTFIPPEDHAASTSMPSPDANVGEKSGIGAARTRGVLYGTFSAECVVRRASKVLEILGALDDNSGLVSPAGVELVDAVRSRLLGWSRGEQGKSVLSARTCAPVRVDTSDQARGDLFGLGAGDRVLSAEGEATVLGATRHSLWVTVEANSASSVSSPGFHRGPRAWGSEVADMRKEDESRGNRGNDSSSSLHRSLTGARGSKIASWSRGTVRQIIGHPEEYVVSRHHTTRTDSIGKFGAATHEHVRDRTVADNAVDLGPDEVQNMLSRWTPSMDMALGRHLSSLADSMAVSSPLDLPFNALEKLPSSKDMFLLASSVAPAAVQVRATLLLYVNDLVLPLLPLVDTAVDNLGPLGGLVHKFRHLLFRQSKLLPLDNVIRPTSGMLPLEAGPQPAPAYTIPLSGVASLPTSPSPAGHAHPPEIRVRSWAQTSKEVDKSVFGQVARHLSHSASHVLSEGPVAFLVELVDAPVLVDGGGTKDESLELLDARANSDTLYRGVFWQVCVEVCSPPIAMFVSTETGGATAAPSPVAPDPVAAGIEIKNRAGEGRGADHGSDVDVATKEYRVEGLVPNPLFSSKGMSPVCMDPGRVALFRSLGFIAGLAVRTGVPLPLSHLSPKWWMLVSDSASSFDESAAVRGTPELTTSRSGCPEEAGDASSLSTGTPHSAIDGVFASLGRLAQAGLAKEEIEEILTDAKFVAPLSNGQVTELLPGGLHRPVTSQNLGEYRALLARFRASEFAPQASAFRAGMEDALPKRVLSLLTWREMEELVCGASSSPPAKKCATY